MIVLYTGRRGCGKTLSMIKDTYKYFKNGWTIYSNIELAFQYEYLSEEDILNISNDPNINNCVLVIDELQVLLDSRRSMKKGNVTFSHFIQQIRKRNIIMLCTTQFTGTVDVRFRDHVDYEAKPYYYSKHKVCEITYIDVTAVDIWEITDERPPIVKIVYDCIPIFEMYDTMNIINNNKDKEKEEI